MSKSWLKVYLFSSALILYYSNTKNKVILVLEKRNDKYGVHDLEHKLK